MHTPFTALLVIYFSTQCKLAAVAATTDLLQLRADSDIMQDWLSQTYRHLHQWPELMFEEHNTSAFIRQTLDHLSVPYQ